MCLCYPVPQNTKREDGREGGKGQGEFRLNIKGGVEGQIKDKMGPRECAAVEGGKDRGRKRLACLH